LTTLQADTTDQRLTIKLLLLAGAVGPVLFIAVYLINGAARPGCSGWHHTISTPSLGDQGWIQVVNFVLYGLFTLAFGAGLLRVLPTGPGSRWGPILFLIVGLGLVTMGAFVTRADSHPSSSASGRPFSRSNSGASGPIFARDRPHRPNLGLPPAMPLPLASSKPYDMVFILYGPGERAADPGDEGLELPRIPRT
jgi:hypothetical protein